MNRADLFRACLDLIEPDPKDPDDIPPRYLLIREAVDHFGLTDPEEIASALFCSEQDGEAAMQTTEETA